MTIQEIKDKIVEIATKHRKEEDDEFAFGYEMEAEDLILGYLVTNNIQLGDYDLKGLLNYDEEYEENRSDILEVLQFDLLKDPLPFEVHKDAKELFEYYNNAFWLEEED